VAGAGGAGDGGCAGVAAAAFAILGAIRRIAEFGKHPGAEDEAKSRQTAHDLGVRVTHEGIGQLALELVDLPRQLLRDSDAGTHAGRKRARDRRCCLELLAAQRRLDLLRLVIEVALAARMAER
jgi:hypothetical protein